MAFKLFANRERQCFLAGHLNRSFLKETKEALVPDLQVNEIHLTSYLPVSQAVQDRKSVEMTSNTVLDGWPNNKADLTSEIRA